MIASTITGGRRLPSFAAGLLSPVLLMLLIEALVGSLHASSPWAIYSVAGLLLVLGACLFPPVRPWFFVSGFALGVPLTAVVVTVFSLSQYPSAAEAGRLAGFLLFPVGLLVGIAGAVAALAARRVELPSWVPGLFLALVPVVLIGGNVAVQKTVQRSEQSALLRLKQIHRAELAYAAARQGSEYTCEGSDLPGLSGLPWYADPQRPHSPRSQLRENIYVFQLDCHPGGFSVHAHPGMGARNSGSYSIREDGKLTRGD